MKTRTKAILLATAGILGLAVMPGLPARAAYQFPALFGPFSGDCTTPNNTSSVVTCTKSNGASFASMAFQAASSVSITGGSIDGTSIGANVRAAIAATTGSFNGLLSGAANTFTGLSTQTGGHVVGIADLTASTTLTAAQEDVCGNMTSAITITLPATPAAGQQVTISDCVGSPNLLTVAANGTGVKILAPGGPATSYTYVNAYQNAKYTYHQTNTSWTIE